MSRTNCNNEKTAAHLQSFPSKLSWTHLHQNENAITNNEPNFNNENNAILIDVKPAATEGNHELLFLNTMWYSKITIFYFTKGFP